MYPHTLARHSSKVAIETNQVLKNTYLLLGGTVLFSGLTAFFAMMTGATIHPILFLAVSWGLLFLVQATQNSALGLLSTFAFTGFMGYALGPMLNLILSRYANGAQLVATAFASTGIVFFALSSYVMTSKKDFNYLSGFLFIGLVLAFLMGLANLFFKMPGLQLFVSGLFALFSSGMILFQTSQIIHGGERNYISATVSIYVSLYNLFISLLHLFTAFGGREE